MLKGIIRSIKQNFKTAEFSSELPKGKRKCPECLGSGHEDVVSECSFCDGEGFIKMSYQEYVDSLPPIEK